MTQNQTQATSTQPTKSHTYLILIVLVVLGALRSRTLRRSGNLRRQATNLTAGLFAGIGLIAMVMCRVPTLPIKTCKQQK